MAKLKNDLKREMEGSTNARLKSIEDAESTRLKSLEAERQEAYKVRHELQVKAVHPDVADYFNPDKHAPALAEWVKSQPPMIGNVLNDPLAHTPEDVAFALTSFKNSIKTPAAKIPSLGDRVQSAKSITTVTEPSKQEYFSEDEMTDKHIETLLRNAKSDPAKLEEIMDKYERTFIHMSK
jgi:hypothetical protein